jgi:hypothetical protein
MDHVRHVLGSETVFAILFCLVLLLFLYAIAVRYLRVCLFRWFPFLASWRCSCAYSFFSIDGQYFGAQVASAQPAYYPQPTMVAANQQQALALDAADGRIDGTYYGQGVAAAAPAYGYGKHLVCCCFIIIISLLTIHSSTRLRLCATRIRCRTGVWSTSIRSTSVWTTNVSWQVQVQALQVRKGEEVLCCVFIFSSLLTI